MTGEYEGHPHNLKVLFPELGTRLIEGLLIERIERANEVLKTRGISTDIDSTELATEMTAIADFNAVHGTEYRLEDLRESRYAMVEWSKDLPGVKDPLKHAIGYWNNPVTLPYLPPTPGSQILFRYLHEQKISVQRVTARPGFTARATKLWYRFNAPWVDESLIHVQEGENINSQFKYDKIAKELKVGYHLEDAVEEAEIIAELGIIVGLVPQPWNEGYEPVSKRIFTLDKALKRGLPYLGVDRWTLKNEPKMIQVYFVLIDSILAKI